MAKYSFKTGSRHVTCSSHLAIEFASHRCDRVFSSKFPRNKPKLPPWKYYGDSLYYKLNCKLKESRLTKRDIHGDLGRSYFNEDHFHEFYDRRRRNSGKYF